MTTTIADPVVTRTDLVARATALRDLLWEEAPQSDRDRRLTDRSIDAVTEAGLLRLMTPRRLGGLETDIRTILDVTTELGRGCGSTGWVAGVLNSGNFMAALLGDRAREEIWGTDPDARVAATLVKPDATVERVEGGLRLSGTWGFASGIWHAEWVGLQTFIFGENGPPEMQLAFVPTSEVTVKDTWKIAGMRGTGSNHVTVEDLFVPEHRLLPWKPAVDGEWQPPHADETLYHSSVPGVLQLFLLGSMIGSARAALDYVVEKAPQRAIAASTYASQVDSVPFQLDVAEATSLVDAAEFHARRIAETVDTHAAAREDVDLQTRARQRMDAAATVGNAREAIDRLMTAHGTSAFAEFNPLQRIWRDINVGSRHGGFGSHIPQEVYGKALLGEDPRRTSFLL